MKKIVNGKLIDCTEEEALSFKSDWEKSLKEKESLKQEEELKRKKTNDAKRKLQEKLEMTAEELDILFGFSK
jgi:hypothetical protein